MKAKLIHIFLLCLLAVSCSSDEKPSIKGTDSVSAEYLTEGIFQDSSASTFSLRISHLPGTLTAICDEYWCDVEVTESDDMMTVSEIRISIDRNSDWTSREALLTLSVEGCSRIIKILQRAEERLQPETDVVYAKREGGELAVLLKANASGQIKVDLRQDSQEEWLEFVEVSRDHLNPQKPECCLTFKSKENHGLGRICGVNITVEGSPVKSQFCIIQQPNTFEEAETIYIKNAGTLDVLIGTDKENIRKVRKLTLTGEMNGLDWTALRSFFYKGYAADPAADAYPVDLDLSEIHSVRGNSSFYHTMGYEPKDIDIYVNMDNEIPDNALERCSNLTGLILPTRTSKIGTYAIAFNDALTSIDIPDNVKEICYGAFQNCAELKKINISDNSHLSILDRYAFNGCGPIEFLNLPVSLTEIKDGCLNFAVKELKVHWPEPPYLRVPPYVKEGSILYVPAGTAPLYREAFGWKRFSSIIEY